MSHAKSPRQISEDILEQACGWFIDFNEGELDGGGRERFNQWLRRSPEHVQAYLEIAATWQDSSRLVGAHPSDATALVNQPLSETNVVPFDPRGTGPSAEVASGPAIHVESSDGQPHMRARLWRARLPWLLPALVACALIAVGIARHRDTYATAAGELRSVLLEDGSTIELDVRSQLRVRFSHDERIVELVDGQALFSVKKDTTRPFTVLTNGARVRAVGTQFNVYHKPVGTTITVVEGRVAVTEVGTPTPAAGETPTFLSAGEQLTVAARMMSHVIAADPAATTAWTQRKLVFDEVSLSEAVAEFNRYNTRQITIEDPSLSKYHIRGKFEASEPQRLLQFLRARFDVDIHEQGNEIRVYRK